MRVQDEHLHTYIQYKIFMVTDITPSIWGMKDTWLVHCLCNIQSKSLFDEFKQNSVVLSDI